IVCLAYANGANDNFKGVATLFGSGTADYRAALLWATLPDPLGHDREDPGHMVSDPAHRSRLGFAGVSGNRLFVSVKFKVFRSLPAVEGMEQSVRGAPPLHATHIALRYTLRISSPPGDAGPSRRRNTHRRTRICHATAQGGNSAAGSIPRTCKHKPF